jgi:hypothetical protein
MTSNLQAPPTVNRSIRELPEMFPAVTELDFDSIDRAARGAALELSFKQRVFVVLEPGDGTHYELLIATTNRASAPYMVASNFGHLATWMGRPTVHPEYAATHFVTARAPWTATVFALFLNRLAEWLEDGRWGAGCHPCDGTDMDAFGWDPSERSLDPGGQGWFHSLPEFAPW